MSYSDLLRDPRWQKKRLEIFERDGWKCIHCGTEKKELQVHHTEYIKGLKPWEHATNSLQTLCIDCHSMLKGLRHGSVVFHGDGCWGYDGKCPKCGGANIRDKGSFDACNDCGFRISFYVYTDE